LVDFDLYFLDPVTPWARPKDVHVQGDGVVFRVSLAILKKHILETILKYLLLVLIRQHILGNSTVAFPSCIYQEM
jgi:hypothetical protein